MAKPQAKTCPICASKRIKTLPVAHKEEQGECLHCGAAWRLGWLDGDMMRQIREFDPDSVQEPYGDPRVDLMHYMAKVG